MAKEIDIKVQEAQRVPNKIEAKRTTPRHIIIKMPNVKNKEKILKAAKEKHRALAGVAQWIECWPANQRVAGSIPIRARSWVTGQVPVGGT